jgi:diadenosine tetraphosphate (Ap4A) HIT family hydrolase
MGLLDRSRGRRHGFMMCHQALLEAHVDALTDWRKDRIGAARRGQNPTVLRRLRSGWAVIADHQRLPGYCLLLHDGDADHLTDLPRHQRAVFLEDLALLGEAVMTACNRLDPELWRINYEVLGNSYPHLHGHVFARYLWEPQEMRRGPVWRYPDLHDPRYELGPQHDDVRAAVIEALDEIARHVALHSRCA